MKSHKKNFVDSLKPSAVKRISTCGNYSPKNNFSIDCLSLSTKKFKDFNLRPSLRKDYKASGNIFEDRMNSKEAKTRIQKFLKSNSICYESNTNMNSTSLKNSSNFLSSQVKKHMNLVNKKKSNGKIIIPVCDKAPIGFSQPNNGLFKSKLLSNSRDLNRISIGEFKKKSQASLERNDHSQNKTKKNLQAKNDSQRYNSIFNVATPNASLAKSIERNKSTDKRNDILNFNNKNSREALQGIYGLTEKMREQKFSNTHKKIKLNDQSACDLRSSDKRLSSKEKLTETEKRLLRDQGKKILKNSSLRTSNKPKLNLSKKFEMHEKSEDKISLQQNEYMRNHIPEENQCESLHFINPLEINKKLYNKNNNEKYESEHKKAKQITELNGILKNNDSKLENQSISSIKDNKKIFPKTTNNSSRNNSINKSVEFCFANSKKHQDNRLSSYFNSNQQIMASNTENMSKSFVQSIPKLNKQLKFSLNDVNSSIHSFQSVEISSSKKKKNNADSKVHTYQKSNKTKNESSTSFVEPSKKRKIPKDPKLPPKRTKSKDKKLKKKKSATKEINYDINPRTPSSNVNPCFHSNDISIRDISESNNTEKVAYSDMYFDKNLKVWMNDTKNISDSVNYDKDPFTIRRLLDDSVVQELYEKSFSENGAMLEHDKFLEEDINLDVPIFNMNGFDSIGEIQINGNKVSLI